MTRPTASEADTLTSTVSHPAAKKRNKCKSICLVKFGIQKHTEMIQGHVHIGSTDQFNQVGGGGHEENDRNEINRVDYHRVWLCIRVTCFSSIGLPD